MCIPALPAGYGLRAARDGDAAGVAAVVDLCARETDTPSFTAPELAADWTTAGFDVARDTRVVVDPTGAIVGYAALYAVQRPPVHPFLWGRVHPAHRGRGLGTALLRWGLRRAEERLPDVPPDVRVSVYAPSPVGFRPSEALLRAEGFRVCRHSLDMRAELAVPPPAPVLPPGVAIEGYRHPAELDAVGEASHEIFRDHRGSVDEALPDYLARFRHWHAEEPGFDASLWFLARSGDELAGLLIGRGAEGADETTGYVSTLGVRRPWRRRGIALALLLHAFAAYRRRGKRAVALSVDAESLTGAVALYRKAGMSVRRRSGTWEREVRPGREISRTDRPDP